MAQFRVFDEETARQLSARITENDSVTLVNSHEIFDGSPRVLVARTTERGKALVISCSKPLPRQVAEPAVHDREVAPPSLPQTPPEPVPTRPVQALPKEELPQYIATGFLGLDDAPYEEEDNTQKKPWWKRLVD